ncbi:LLM class flavin-dependent oxidoreductase [Flavisphingomonas formosensis]|uniref:LLM class flavin-dependent oxidoreductase n=1 Tax=Flavisphingomonas formosensis TaxID=861534 RepID=UPI0012FB4CD8|nr:LLM class flavin-dependent oxidoreductase [Sphingomonas formosensis]
MPRLIMRFDLRNVAQERNAELYRTALDMAAWAEDRGFDGVQLAEHHGSDDGYVPSPLVFGGALAARTKRMKLRFVLVLPLYDPVRLAEDLAVLDVISDGRVIPILAAGYAPHEFAMFGVALGDRPALMTEGVAALRKAWTGKPFLHRGRPARVMPRPIQGDAMPIWMGGSSPAGARRAAELAERFYSNDTALWDIFRARKRALGTDPGPAPNIGQGFLVVSEDPDREWKRMGPWIAAELDAYSKFGASARQLMGDVMDAEEGSAKPPMAVDLTAIRAMNAYPILTPEETASYVRGLGPEDELAIHPLISGLPAEIAWEQLEAFERHALPLVRDG